MSVSFSFTYHNYINSNMVFSVYKDMLSLLLTQQQSLLRQKAISLKEEDLLASLIIPLYGCVCVYAFEITTTEFQLMKKKANTTNTEKQQQQISAQYNCVGFDQLLFDVATKETRKQQEKKNNEQRRRSETFVSSGGAIELTEVLQKRNREK